MGCTYDQRMAKQARHCIDELALDMNREIQQAIEALLMLDVWSQNRPDHVEQRNAEQPAKG